jgi:nitroreductase
MNETIELLKNHKSVRDFVEDFEIPEEDFQQILDATRQAASWKNGQFYSIVVVKDKVLREKLVELSPENPQMAKSSEVVYFIGDINRSKVAAGMHQDAFFGTGVEPILLATVDATLAAQNLVVASEALGYGTVIMGLIRDRADEVVKTLNLPDYTVPLFSISIGKAASENQVKPRLPEEAVVHIDQYKVNTPEQIATYDVTEKEFASGRTRFTWSEKIAREFSKEPKQASTKVLKDGKLL